MSRSGRSAPRFLAVTALLAIGVIAAMVLLLLEDATPARVARTDPSAPRAAASAVGRDARDGSGRAGPPPSAGEEREPTGQPSASESQARERREVLEASTLPSAPPESADLALAEAKAATQPIAVPARQRQEPLARELAASFGWDEGSPRDLLLTQWMADHREAQSRFLEKPSPPSAERTRSFSEAADARRRKLVQDFGAEAAADLARRVPLYRMAADGSLVRVDANGAAMPEPPEPRDR